jgi:hypothetical protein
LIFKIEEIVKTRLRSSLSLMLIAMEMKIAEKLSKTISLTDSQWHPKK